MSLEQKIMTELKAAMLAKNEAALRSLRAVKAAILLAKTSEGARGDLTEDDEIKLLQKLVKQRKDSLEIFQQQNRSDLAQKEQEEIAVIEKFLPAQLTARRNKSRVSEDHCCNRRFFTSRYGQSDGGSHQTTGWQSRRENDLSTSKGVVKQIR